MTLQWNFKTLRTAALVAAVLGLSLFAAAQSSDSERISFYMHQARLEATQAAADLQLLQTYSKAGVPWQVHFNRLQQVEDHVTGMIKDYNHLSALRYKSAPSQAEAFDRIQPLLQDLQSQVKESLRFLVYNSAAVNMQPFTERIHVQYSAVNQVFAALCDCARRNDVLVASERDRTAPSDCSKKSM